MVPKFVMPDFMQTFSNISPMSWGLEGFLDVLLRREGIEAVLPEVLALTLFGLILLILAAMIFKMKTRRGL
jgi:ABC-2 type transport system permease protein